jgi:hypothetical protein
MGEGERGVQNPAELLRIAGGLFQEQRLMVDIECSERMIGNAQKEGRQESGWDGSMFGLVGEGIRCS